MPMKALEVETDILPPMNEAESAALVTADATVARSHAGQKRFRIGRDSLKFDGLTEAQRSDVEWLWTYCQQRDLGTAEIGKLIMKGTGPETYTYESLYQFWTGRRAEQKVNLAPMCEAISAFRRKVDSAPVHNGYLQTRMGAEIQAYALRAQKRQLIGILVGKMTVGKTTPLQELARRDPSVIYSRMPTAGTRARFLEQLAGKLGMGTSQSVGDLTQRVIDSFDEKMLLVVDESDQAFNSTKISAGLATLDFLRELWDQRRCGILLVMDDAGRDHFESGLHKKRLGRLWRRRLPLLQLPDVPYIDDLDLFAAQYGLPPASNEMIEVEIKNEKGRVMARHKDAPRRLQDAVVARDGLLIWLSLLEDAHAEAQARGRVVSWGAVIKAHSAMATAEAQ